jgi:hypothetical protein
MGVRMVKGTGLRSVARELMVAMVGSQEMGNLTCAMRLAGLEATGLKLCLCARWGWGFLFRPFSIVYHSISSRSTPLPDHNRCFSQYTGADRSCSAPTRNARDGGRHHGNRIADFLT